MDEYHGCSMLGTGQGRYCDRLRDHYRGGHGGRGDMTREPRDDGEMTIAASHCQSAVWLDPLIISVDRRMPVRSVYTKDSACKAPIDGMDDITSPLTDENIPRAEEASGVDSKFQPGVDGPTDSPDTSPRLSKKAIKKAAQAERFAAAKIERRAREKEAKKEKKRVIAAKRAAGELDEEDSEKDKRRKKPRIYWGGKVVVDLGFDERMSEKVSILII